MQIKNIEIINCENGQSYMKVQADLDRDDINKMKVEADVEIKYLVLNATYDCTKSAKVNGDKT